MTRSPRLPKSNFIDVKGWAVMKKQCPTCPFNQGRDPLLASKITQRVSSLSHSQICHHPVLYKKQEKNLCRGARDIQLQLLYALNLITAPTDEAFKLASDRALNSQEKK